MEVEDFYKYLKVLYSIFNKKSNIFFLVAGVAEKAVVAPVHRRINGYKQGLMLWILRLTMIISLTWLAGLGWHLMEMAVTYAHSQEYTPFSTVIVVLTGGKDRVDAGIELLEQERAAALFISGVDSSVSREALTRAYPRLARFAPGQVELGYEAHDTLGNAREVAVWLKEQPYRSILLVTSHYHMPRSLALFRRHMPEMNVTPIPIEGFDGEEWWRVWKNWRLIIGEYHKRVVCMARGTCLRWGE